MFTTKKQLRKQLDDANYRAFAAEQNERYILSMSNGLAQELEYERNLHNPF